MGHPMITAKGGQGSENCLIFDKHTTPGTPPLEFQEVWVQWPEQGSTGPDRFQWAAPGRALGIEIKGP